MYSWKRKENAQKDYKKTFENVYLLNKYGRKEPMWKTNNT